MLSAFCLKAQNRPDVCPACVQDTTGGYISIVDTMKWNPICNYELLTKEHLVLVHVRKIDRNKIHFFPHAMDDLYSGSGDSRGHVIPFEDLAWSPVTARASMDLRRNLAPEPQDQNVGTELHAEDRERGLADSIGAVKVYGGTVGSIGSVKGINKPEAYWKVIVTDHQWICYFMPTTGAHIAYADLEPYCRVDYANLVRWIGIDPLKIIK